MNEILEPQEGPDTSNPAFRHGHAQRGKPSPEYVAWANMLSRCRPGRPDSARYYDRGVRVCDRWDPRKGGSFELFLTDMGPKPGPNYSLDKDGIKPGNLLYGPGLCRWATYSEQSTARRNTHWLTYKGETRSLQQWADELGVKRSALLKRVRLGWTPEEIIETPIDNSTTHFKPATFIEYKGIKRSLADWSAITGINKSTLSWRMRHGWSPERALTTP